MPVPDLADGYYWVRCGEDEGTRFIALLEEGLWYTVGIAHPIDVEMRDIVCPVQTAVH